MSSKYSVGPSVFEITGSGRTQYFTIGSCVNILYDIDVELWGVYISGLCYEVSDGGYCLCICSDLEDDAAVHWYLPLECIECIEFCEV